MSFPKTCLMILAGAAALIPSLYANVTPCTIFQSNMVLQRETPVPVWGTAAPSEDVTVTFAGQTLTTKADDKGDWSVTLKPLAIQKTGSDLVIKGKNEVKLTNVVVGDVWLCSGQSNMEMSFGWGVLDGNQFVKESDNYPLIRDIKFTKMTCGTPLKNPHVSAWRVAGSKTTASFSAAAYFFAKKIFDETGIPIGILDDNWSGCRIEIFIPPCGYELQYEPKNPDEEKTMASFKAQVAKYRDYDMSIPESRGKMLKSLDAYRKYADQAEAAVKEGKMPPALPSTMVSQNGSNYAYYAMMAPIVRFPVKGAIWYQGCSNGNEGDSYYLKMRALIEGWRKVWKNDFPVYFVQLAAFTGATNDPAGGNGYARIREAQRRSLDIPKTGMACTIDIGMQGDIHPKNKQDVGARLALWALRDLYGKKDVVVSGPLFKSMKVEGKTVRLSFDYADGLMTAAKPDACGPATGHCPTCGAPGKTAPKICAGYGAPVPTPGVAPKHFAVAGADKVWHWADAKIDGKDIVLTCDKVPAPVAVRYAYRAYPDGVNVYNAAGLPMVPFRTDNW